MNLSETNMNFINNSYNNTRKNSKIDLTTTNFEDFSESSGYEINSLSSSHTESSASDISNLYRNSLTDSISDEYVSKISQTILSSDAEIDRFLNGDESVEDSELIDSIEQIDIGKSTNSAVDEIILFPGQIEHAERILQKFLQYFIACDFSLMGRGKSVIFCWVITKLVEQRGIKHVVMICPTSITKQWEAYGRRFNLPFIRVIGYQRLRGTNSGNENFALGHGMLNRDSRGNFEVTQLVKDWTDEGLVVCFDEFHNLKNLCDQQKAATAFTRYFEERRRVDHGNSFYGAYYISTTPFDKPEHCVNWCYVTSIIRASEALTREQVRNVELEQVYQYCCKINVTATNKIYGKLETSPKNAVNNIYKLCSEIILKAVSSFIVVPEDTVETTNQSIYNVYMDVPREALDLIKIGDAMIHTTTPLNYITPEMIQTYNAIINPTKPINERCGITHGNITQHTVKTYYIICPLAIKVLEEIPNSKVVIFLDFKESIEVAYTYLQRYSPIVTTGDDSIDVRDTRTRKFQEPNLDCRVLITMNQISSFGVEFDDQTGDFPRVGITIPGHVIGNLVQSPGRLNRELTKSDNMFFIVRPKNAEDFDASINRSIDAKSKVFIETLAKNGIIPPNIFKDLIDPERYNMNELLKQNAGYKDTTTVVPEKKKVKILPQRKISESMFEI